MKKEQAFEILRDNMDRMKQFHVKSLSIFGSVARDEATKNSDIDILVEFEPDATVGLFMFVNLKDYLSSILDCDVDLATYGSLRQEMKEKILKELIHAA